MAEEEVSIPIIHGSRNNYVGGKGEKRIAKQSLKWVQYGSRDLKSREANRAALLWMDKYAKDIVKIDRVKGLKDATISLSSAAMKFL